MQIADGMRRSALFVTSALALALAGCLESQPVEPPITEPPIVEPPGRPEPARPLEDLVIADTPPPSITGGTLLVAADGVTAIAADPDRDQVWVVDLSRQDDRDAERSVTFEPGDEPGRIAEGVGAYFVALRGAGALVRLDAETLDTDWRVDACGTPRGVAFDPADERVLLACETGELIAFAPADGRVLTTARPDVGLRDVVVENGRIWLSRFRTAEVLQLDASLTVTMRLALPVPESFASFAERTAAAAWRMRAEPNGGVAVSYQLAQESPVTPEPGGYGGFACERAGIVSTAIARVSPAGHIDAQELAGLVLPVDVASNGDKVAVAPAGSHNDGGVLFPEPWVTTVPAATVGTTDDPCFHIFAGPDMGAPLAGGRHQAMAVDFDGSGRLVVQTRDPWAIQVFDGESQLASSIGLPGIDARDTGHDLFHLDAGGGVACASCHLESGDDALVWQFEGIGPRRTQELRGGLLGTEPFHWSGDMADFEHLAHDVFTGRMSGPRLPLDYANALASWVDTLPLPERPAIEDPQAVARGEALFTSEQTQCAVCHAGPRLTSAGTLLVGTGEPMQVPSLRGVVFRERLMHDGCATSLHARFDPRCGGGEEHGHTAHLSDDQIDDLVAYLRTL